MAKRKCLNCNHKQEVNEKNTWQDDKGKFTVCEKCDSSYDVEITEKEMQAN